MGMITIKLQGSFGQAREKQFSALEIGHAAAIGEAIKYLVDIELPAAIRNDHKCHNDGMEPNSGFAGMGKIIRNQDDAVKS